MGEDSCYVVVTGASDDLIEIEGAIREEFTLHDEADEGDLLAFSDGSILRIAYTNAGIWRITPVVRGTAFGSIELAPEDDENNYSDRATLGPDITWVVHGIGFTKPPKDNTSGGTS